jgi:hypothetical protein
MVAAVAGLDPHTAPKAVQAETVAMAQPAADAAQKFVGRIVQPAADAAVERHLPHQDNRGYCGEIIIRKHLVKIFGHQVQPALERRDHAEADQPNRGHNVSHRHTRQKEQNHHHYAKDTD